MSAPYRICFVFLGNLCLSPTAEGVSLAFYDAGLGDHNMRSTSRDRGVARRLAADDRSFADAQRRG